MSEKILKVADDFWNLRGDFKIGGVLNIGTHASLVKRRSGKFVLLDAYTLRGDVKKQVDALTRDGADIEAIINLHPFHTVHVGRAHQQYPKARLFGTQRHVQIFPELPWQPQRTESAEFAALYADDFAFSVPQGVVFVSPNEHLHFSSVLAYHRSSRTIHVDDTLMFFPLPGALGKLRKPELGFHPTLAQTLLREAGAANAFRSWAQQLATDWGDAQNLCAAHSAALLGRQHAGAPLSERILKALNKVEKTLKRHQRRFS